MILLNVRPNWRNPLTESLGFSTKIFESQDGREVREAFRSLPKQTFEFSINLNPTLLRRFAALMTWAREEPVVFSVPTLGVRLTGEGGGLSDFFPCAPAFWMKPGAMVTARNSIWEITSVQGNGFRATPVTSGLPSDPQSTTNLVTENGQFNITTEDGLFNLVSSVSLSEKLATGTRVQLALPGRLQSAITANMLTAQLGTMPLTFMAEPKHAVDYRGVEEAVYNGMPVFPFKQNWREQVASGFDSFRDTMESDRGPWAHFWQTVYTSRSWAALYSEFGSESVFRLMSFFATARGRQGGFNFRAPTDEFSVVRAAPNGNYIDVEGEDVVLSPNRDDTARAIYLKQETGPVIYRETENSYKVDGNTRVILTDRLPVNLSKVQRVGQVFQCRFVEDEARFDWLTNDVAEVSLGVRTIDYLRSTVRNLTTEDGQKNLVSDQSVPRNLTTES